MNQTSYLRRLRLTLVVLVALATAIACSDTNEGGNAGGANGGANGGGSGAGCTGTFCLETDIRIGATPMPLLFPDIEPAATNSQVLSVSHVGNSGVLSVSAYRFEPDNGEFSIPDFAPFTLNSSVLKDLTIVYTPKVAGPRTVLLILTNNSDISANREFKVPLQVKENVGTLNVQPNPVDFGPVASGQCADKKVKVYNAGSKETSIAQVSLSPSGSPDFSVKTQPAGTAIQPNEADELVLSFCPKPGEDNDTTELSVEGADGKKVTVQVFGAEITPRIVIVPPTLNYGSMALKTKGTRSFKIFSQGLSDLEVSKIELSPLSKVKSITFSESGPFTLKPNEARQIDVELTADTALANDGAAVAQVVVSSSDLSKPNVSIPVFAKTETGVLKITPSDLLDFAIVGKGVQVERTIEIFNAGTADIELKSIELVDDSNGEYTIIQDNNFGPIANNKASHILKPAEYRAMKVSFKATGPVGAQAKGKLRFLSDDPSTPDWPLVLVADRAEGSQCNIQLIPNKTNFGVLGYGQSKILSVTVKNTGSGYCNLDATSPGPIRILDCPSPVTLPGLPSLGAPKCATLGIPSFSTFAPSTSLFNLGPGQTGKINLNFDAPTDGGLFSDPTQILKRYGFLSVRYKDQATGVSKWYPQDPTDAAKVGSYAPNLEAGVGKSAVAVLPDQIDFGLVTIGCKSKVHEASVFNAGITPAFVTKVELQGCGVEVDKVNWPAIPKTGLEVTQTVPVKFGLQYAPQNEGKDSCQMVISTGVNGLCTNANGGTGNDCQTTADCGTPGDTCLGQVFTVPLKGEGTLLDEFTDEFEQGAGKKVDVLFVIDNSGSMGEEQTNLSDNFNTFVQIATLWQNDYHLGVVTTDMDAGKDTGKLREAGGTRVITNMTPNGTNLFKSMAKVGTNGASEEQGLAAAEAALTLPNVYDSGKACSTDADCKGDGFCVASPDGGAKACGGHNRGFLRKQAGLEIVFVSDEEDSSPAALKYYANFFWSLKGAANKGLFHAHAIVGLSNSGSSGGCDAQKGNRYITIANDSGGKTASICDKSFSSTLQNIGEVAFGLSHQFFLTMTAEPSTIEVKINGTVCSVSAKSWQYDGNSNSVIFVAETAGGTCVPKKGDQVKIHYKTLCFP